MLEYLKKLNPTNEPIGYVVAALLILYTLYKVLGPEKMPVDDVLSEEYATYILGVFATLVARSRVFTVPSKDAAVEVALLEAAEVRTKDAE